MRKLIALAVLLAPTAACFSALARANPDPSPPIIETCGFLPVGACEPPPPPPVCFDERGIQIVDCPLP